MAASAPGRPDASDGGAGPVDPRARKPKPAAATKKRRLRFRAPRKLKVTREGKYFLGITFGVGLAAINTGNNLLYLLLGVLLALILVSGIMSEIALRGLTVRRRLPPRAQVGRPHLVEIEVHNKKQRLPSYAIEVEDIRANQPADKRCFFLKVSPQSTQVAAYRRTPQRRGREAHVAFRVATRFPFGLFEKSRQIDVPGELIIYPAVHTVRLPPPRVRAQGHGARVATRGAGDELLGLRAYRPGDDTRQVHWRKTAAAGHLVLREHTAEGAPEIEIELDDVCAALDRPEGDEERRRFLDGLETRIREVASRAVAHLARGDGVVIVTTGGTRIRGNPRLGSDPILRFLALLEPTTTSTRLHRGEAAE
ncbi:MAG: DUF58 domain-containing protein [Myxococcales bacterium]|nr:DUF58 domain-containing protein [Myxococcales bacterium]